ncbi:MAG: hypothetical protein QMD85_05430, partial [Candidatus Aenigmarchaeota archaeon]|nr:hypothetical protein [Candidatus Aenigmarchaeota archaeon]
MKYNKLACAIIVFSAILWLAFLYANMGYWWDELVYLELGKNLGAYEINFGQESFRPPLFPIFVAAFHPLDEIFLKFLVIMLAVASFIALYLFAARIDGKLAIVSLLFFSSSPLFFFFG